MAKKGRPPKFKSKDEMQEKIDAYFEECKGKILTDDEGKVITDKYGQPVIIDRKPLTVTGLALALGFSSRQSLLDYEAKKEFLDTITRAKARVEEYTEMMLFDKNASNGAKFSLANNFEGWKDRKNVEAELKDDVHINIELSDD